MAALSVVLKTRIEPELRAALERQATREGRELSQLVRNTLRAAMVAAGQLSEVIERA